ncbi:enoyl-CoA hydratase-related protein [Pseudomonadota bacterium]|nr:enoyl-CoA hydratase-related protein [Pseudomonadota bacterium]
MAGPSSFELYANKYENIELKRNDGVLEIYFGSNMVLNWDKHLSNTLIELFSNVRDDPFNVIVILNGRDEFWLAKEESLVNAGEIDATSPLEIFLEIKVPVISVIPGNLGWFSEIPLMADIVLASERSVFNEFSLLQEELSVSSFVRKVVLRHLLGPRERYFCYAVEPITAHEAKNIGLVSELHDQTNLLNRAKELSFNLLRRDRKRLQVVKAESLALLKEQIEKVKNQFLKDYGNDSGSVLKMDQHNSRRVHREIEEKNVATGSDLDVIRPPEPHELLRSNPLRRNPLENEGFSLHGDEISEIIEDATDEATEVQQGPASIVEKKELSVDRVISALSNEGNESEVKLNLAKAYIELGHYQSAELILDELSNDFGDELKDEISTLQNQILS